ncbi:MAG: glucose-6-phosphate dehydrogenase [Mycobacterium sp.]
MSARLVAFRERLLRQYFGASATTFARMKPTDVERLLSDDTLRRLNQIHMAARELGHTQPNQVRIKLESLFITPCGLLYAAELETPSRRPLYYLATPKALFDEFADRVGSTTLPPNSAAVIDRRVARELVFPWPLDATLRRTLDSQPVLRAG